MNLMDNSDEQNKNNNCSNKQFFLDYFKNNILWEQLENFPKQTDHLENTQLIVGCFINVGYSQTPNILMRLDSLKKLRIYLKHDIQLFYPIFITISNSLFKNLITEKANSELRKIAYQIFFDFIANYESFGEIDYTKIFAFIFETLTELIVKEKSDDTDYIPKMLMNFISNNLFYQEIYSKIIEIANFSATFKHLGIYFKVMESLLNNTPKAFIFELIDWKELFELFFKKDTHGKERHENLYVNLFIEMINLINNDFSKINLDKETLADVNDYLLSFVY